MRKNLIFFSLFFGAYTIHAQIITTVAGNGTLGYSGDGGQAYQAQMYDPEAIVLDALGNLYISDREYDVVRRVDGITGIITTYAGNGKTGYSGDGGVATAAELDGPFGLALDAFENLYIIDQGSHVIRKVEAGTGIISTVAGVTGIGGTSGDGGPATSARIAMGYGVTVDKTGNIFIATLTGIRKVDFATGIINTIAGNGTSGFSGDGGLATLAQTGEVFYIAVDTLGNVYFTDYSNSRLRKIDAVTGIINTIAGDGSLGFAGDGGPATAAGLGFPSGLALDASGNIYVAETYNYRVRKIDGTTGFITTVAGNGTAGYSGDGGLATAAKIYATAGLAVNSSGNLYLADLGNHVVRKIAFGATIPLPLTLVDFNVRPNGNLGVDLTWTTSEEINTATFEIQRSNDGLSWKKIATQAATGNSTLVSNYTFIDNAPFNGVNYYRLKMMDLNGTFSLSTVKAIRFSLPANFSIFPNPARNYVNITLPKFTPGMSINLLNGAGQKLMTWNISTGNGTKFGFPVSKYLNGIYTVVIEGNGVSLYMMKLIITR